MSFEIIGNGNLPCVYVQRIFLDLENGFLKAFVQVPDFVDSGGNVAWSSTDFLSQEIYLNFCVVNQDPKRVGENFINDIKNNNLGYGFQAIKLEKLRTRKIENAIFFEKEFISELPQSFLNSIDLYVVSYISFEIEQVQNLNLPKQYRTFTGPLNIEKIKETGRPLTKAMKFELNGQEYHGAIVKNEEGEFFSGAVLDENSQLLQITDAPNSKTIIIPKLSSFNLRNFQWVTFDLNIKKPLWSISYRGPNRGLVIKAIFSIDEESFIPSPIMQFNKNPLVKFNTHRISNGFTALVMDSTKEDNFTKIRINHENEGEHFFLVTGSKDVNDTTIPKIKINVNLQFPNSLTVLQQTIGNVDYIKQTFLNTDTKENYSNFLTCFLKIIAANREIDLSSLNDFKTSLTNALSGEVTYDLKLSLASTMSSEYNSLKNRFNFGNTQIELNKEFVYDEETDYQQKYYKQGFFPTYRNSQYQEFITSYNLIDILKQENVAFGGAPAITSGKQHVSPSLMLGKSVSVSNPFRFLVDNLDLLQSVEPNIKTYIYQTQTETSAIWRKPHEPYSYYWEVTDFDIKWNILARPWYYMSKSSLFDNNSNVPKILLYNRKILNQNTETEIYFPSDHFRSSFDYLRLNLTEIRDLTNGTDSDFYKLIGFIIIFTLHNIYFNFKELFFLSSSSNKPTSEWEWTPVTDATLTQLSNTPNQFLIFKLDLSYDTKVSLSNLGFANYLNKSDTAAHHLHSIPQSKYFIVSTANINSATYYDLEANQGTTEEYVKNEEFFESISVSSFQQQTENEKFYGNFEMFQPYYSYSFLKPFSNLNANSLDEGDY